MYKFLKTDHMYHSIIPPPSLVLVFYFYAYMEAIVIVAYAIISLFLNVCCFIYDSISIIFKTPLCRLVGIFEFRSFTAYQHKIHQM